MLVPSEQWQQTSDLRTLCSSILASAVSEPDKYQVGLTKIFFRAGLLARFEQLRHARLTEVATLLQRNIRRHFAVRDFQRVRTMVVGIQRLVRTRAAKQRAVELRRERAAVSIQKAARGFIERQRYQAARSAVVAIQAVARGQHYRANFKEQRREQVVLQLQSMLRGA